MANHIDTDLCIIGAGSGGLSVAAGAVQMGARTVLIERGKMGGDCLNYGCVPSKSLIAAANSFRRFQQNPILHLTNPNAQAPMADVRSHIENVISTIEPHDSVERFEGLGVHVIQDEGRFVDKQTVQAGANTIKAKWFVIATGSRPVAPPIPGLAEISYFTNETIFGIDYLPKHLIVLGGGPIGCELAQAFVRLGSRVSIVDMGPVLAKDDPELTAIVRQTLLSDGIELFENAKVLRAGPESVLKVEHGGKEITLEGTDLLIAAGRRPNIENLNCEAAGIETGKNGINVDRRLRTSNRQVFAIGDAAGGLQFTHVAGQHAGVVIKNALFRIPAKIGYSATPWATYTTPEIAHVGMTEAEASNRKVTFVVQKWPFLQNDRAMAEHDTEGQIKVIAKPNGQILGASIVGANASELIFPWALAIQNKLKLSAMAQAVAPYPTRSEVSKRAAGAFYSPKLFSSKTQRMVRWLLKLPF